ncbi:hypothetical protein FRB90_005398 [Tulasnella sp. 427]|nr:hypothetical protein FRB90_005398 [Tulasnella sp. 427]
MTVNFQCLSADAIQAKQSISFILTTLPTFTLGPASPLPTRITKIPTIYPPLTSTTTPCPTSTVTTVSTTTVKVPVTTTVVQPTTITSTATITSTVTKTTEIVYTQSCSSTTTSPTQTTSSTTTTTKSTTTTPSTTTTTTTKQTTTTTLITDSTTRTTQTTPTQTTPSTTTTTTTPTKSSTTTTIQTTTTITTTQTTRTTATTTTTDKPCQTNYPPDWAGKNFTYKGVNIAGFEWGCLTDGSCTYPNSPPLTSTADGPGQMKWFVSNGMNTFRLPIGWQYVTPALGGAFDATEWATYDKLVQSCLAVNAYCIIDIHNYARWNNQIIGQSAVPDAPFVKLWQMIASYYASQPRVIFGLMNEPYRLNIATWAATLQKVVTAIRAIAPKHVILLPGVEFAHADTFISSGSAAALDAIVNPDGSKTNLIFDIHQWLDKANNGTDPNCVTDNIAVFAPLAQWLRCHGRQAFLTATGGGNDDTTNCNPLLCNQMQFLLANSDVFVGYTGWAAGSYDSEEFPAPS